MWTEAAVDYFNTQFQHLTAGIDANYMKPHSGLRRDIPNAKERWPLDGMVWSTRVETYENGETHARNIIFEAPYCVPMRFLLYLVFTFLIRLTVREKFVKFVQRLYSQLIRTKIRFVQYTECIKQFRVWNMQTNRHDHPISCNSCNPLHSY